MTGSLMPTSIELDCNAAIWTVTFSANGKFLLSGSKDGVRVWRLEDGKQVGTTIVTPWTVLCLATSKDDRWVAAGTYNGGVFVWDAGTPHGKVFSHKESHYNVNGVDFSPDSTRLLVASDNGTVAAWDVTSRTPIVGPLRHERPVIAAKYSPQGNRIATAAQNSVRVYDSEDGRLLIDAKINVTPWLNTGLAWANDQLFAVSDGNIKQVEASTGSVVREWSVPGTKGTSCIALPQHGQFIAFSASRTVMFWDTLTRAQLGPIHHAQDIRSFALSPDDQLLAIGGESGKITVQTLSHVTESVPLARLHPTFQEPDFHIDKAVLDSWNHDRLADVDALLTQTIADSPSPGHHVFANRAFIRTRLRQYDVAIEDAEKSISIQPSVIGYIAKCVALICKGKRHAGYRICDIAFEHFHSTHVTFLLLVKAIIVFMDGEHEDAIARLDDLIATLPSNSICFVLQAYMCLVSGNSCMESNDYERAVVLFERARTQIRRDTSRQLLVISLISGWKFDDLDVTIRQRLCEALYAAGRFREGGESLLEIVNTFHEEIYTDTSRPIIKWVSDFSRRCLSGPRSTGDIVLNVGRQDGATMHNTHLSPTAPVQLLREWAKSTLANCNWNDALTSTFNFVVPRFSIYRAVCERLETMNLTMDAGECFRQMMDELVEQINTHHEQAEWVLNFRRRCSGALEGFGDAATRDERLDDAISLYSAVLRLNPPEPQGQLIKRSKAYLAKGLWEDALIDANRVVTLDPSSPWGYERKHAALHQAGNYESAIEAFEMMLSKMLQSPDPSIRECHGQYIDPRVTKMTIRRVVQDVIHESPRILINTISGRLLNKSQRASAFESLPLFKELTSSMTTQVDHARIEHNVTQYYRYAMLSHKWDDNEPLYEKVIHFVIYDLEESPTHNKLQMFCKLVKDAGLHWAWSDTCCINKSDHFVLQEALVAMFKWYQGSAVTLVLLRGVRSPSRRGDLIRSVWNTRAWTFQEYHASTVVRFYNEDWTLYLSLDIHNHKESHEIIKEMEEATGVPAQALMELRPGLGDVREKLCLASQRQTTLVEDAAYSLLGMFSISMPIMYGEGNQALGRLLAQLLTSSGDTSILAWTGRSGSFNSCLPSKIIVFNQRPTTHIPLATEGAQMDSVTAELRSSLNLVTAIKLYVQLSELPVPSFAGQRMKLPCLAFQLGQVCVSGRAFRAKVDCLGTIEIRTTEDLSRLDSLILVHPWIDFLLHRHPIETVMETDSEEELSLDGSLSSSGLTSNSPMTKRRRASRLVSRLRRQFGTRHEVPRDIGSLSPPLHVSTADKQMQALRLIARLRQPFGALLFTQTRQNVREYRRVAAETMITVRVQEDAPLKELMNSVRILDVL